MNSNGRWLLAALALLLAGCGGAGGLHPVSGTVKYVGGGVPQGEIATIHFDPIEGTTAPGEKKTAQGTIAADGSYQLTTLEQNDGAYAGEYKVTLRVHKTYIGQQSMVANKYTSPKSTPLTAKVTSGDNTFHFEVHKAPGT